MSPGPVRPERALHPEAIEVLLTREKSATVTVDTTPRPAAGSAPPRAAAAARSPAPSSRSGSSSRSRAVRCSENGVIGSGECLGWLLCGVGAGLLAGQASVGTGTAREWEPGFG